YFPALLLIVGVFVPPLLLAIAHHLTILGIPRQLLATRIRPTLTIRQSANPLLGTVPRRQKQALAVKTTTGLAPVGSSDQSSRNPGGQSKPRQESKRNQKMATRLQTEAHGCWRFRQTSVDHFWRVKYGGAVPRAPSKS